MSNDIAAKPTTSFSVEFLSSWQQLPNKALFLVLLAAWLGLFHFLGNSTLGYVNSPSLLTWMYHSYEGDSNHPFTGDDSHGILIPVAVVILMWFKRKELLAVNMRVWTPGLIIIAVALLIHISGFLIQQPRVSVIGLFLGLYGLMGLAWGPGWMRASFFPVMLFVFAVPIGSAADIITFPLRLMVTKLVAMIGQHLLGINVICEGTRLFKMPYQYEYDVAAACSGIRSLVAILAIALVYGFMSFQRWRERAIIIACAVPLAVIGNTFRLLAIVVAAEMGGQQQGAAVHDSAVWSMLPYIPAMLGLVLIGRWLEKRQARAERDTGVVKPSTTP